MTDHYYKLTLRMPDVPIGGLGSVREEQVYYLKSEGSITIEPSPEVKPAHFEIVKVLETITEEGYEEAIK